MLKISIFVAIALGLAACDNNNVSNLDGIAKKIGEQETRDTAARASCRRNMGSCSLSATCGKGFQVQVAGKSTLDTSRDDETCEAKWNAATSR